MGDPGLLVTLPLIRNHTQFEVFDKISNRGSEDQIGDVFPHAPTPISENLLYKRGADLLSWTKTKPPVQIPQFRIFPTKETLRSEGLVIRSPV